MTVDHAYQIAYAEALSDAWLDDLAPRVGRVYGRALRLWVAHCAIAGLDPLDNSELELFLTGLDERYAVATIETFRCGVVAFHDQLGGEPGHELEHIASALELARTADVNTMAASYLAEGSEAPRTRRATERVLREWFGFCRAVRVAPLAAPIAVLEAYEAWLNLRGHAAAAIAQRLVAIHGFVGYVLSVAPPTLSTSGPS